MEDYSLRRQMYEDLMEAYKKVAPHCWTQQQAYERMVKQPAPRYYVTAKQAYQIIARMVKGDFERVNMMLPLRRRMYYTLFDEFVSLCEKPMCWLKSGIIDDEGKVDQSRLPSYVRTREYHRMKREQRKEKQKWIAEKMSEETKQ